MKNVRTIRSRLGISQVQLAEVLGCTQGNVSGIERGEYGGSPELAGTLIKFARSRGLAISYDHIYGEQAIPELVQIPKAAKRGRALAGRR